MTDPMIRIEEHGAYARIVIDRPAKRNAMNAAARAHLRDALAAVAGRFPVVILTGTDKSFCAGMDLSDVRADDAVAWEAASRDWIDTLMAIRRHPAIFIAAINGVALGGGLSLINVCDLAIAADEASIGMPEMGFGIYPMMAGPTTQKRIAPKDAAWLVYTAERIDGPTAREMKLVNRSVPLAELDAAARTLAERIGAFSAVALTESKRALDLIPTHIDDWAGGMLHGVQVNKLVRASGRG